MGVRLMQYYKYVTDQKGMDGRTALARFTIVSSISAANTPDSPEIVARFQKAVEQITGKPAPKY